MTNAIVPIQASIVRSMDDAERAASAMASSGFFQDSRTAAQAVVKILAGQELGFGPFASMKGVHIIQGGPSLSANLMAAAVKRSGRYNYRVSEMTDKVCSIKFLEYGEEIGVSTFTAEDARKAGTKNMDKFPRNMLFARAMSNGCRWYCPDVFNGNTVYTPEELGANVNEDGEVIDVTPTQNHPQIDAQVERKAEPEPQPMRQAPPPEPPAAHSDDGTRTPAEHMSEITGLPINRVQSTLKFSDLDTAALEPYEHWWDAYKSGRNAKMTPQEAGTYANLLRGKTPNPDKAIEWMKSFIVPEIGEEQTA